MRKLIILPPAAHFLKKIKEKSLKTAFKKIVNDIMQNPYIGEPKVGDLAGVYCCEFFDKDKHPFKVEYYNQAGLKI